MCGIFASRDKMRFYELAAKNSYRGSHSHSISYYDGNRIQVMTKGLGEMPEIDLEDGYYYIGNGKSHGKKNGLGILILCYGI